MLAKAVSGLWAGEGRKCRARQCQPRAVWHQQRHRGAARATHGTPGAVLSRHRDLPPAFPPSPFTLLFSPPPTLSCCEAPHSFPHSHFHFPALGFASTLSSTSFAQMTSNKTVRDAPIRLHSWCCKEVLRDRGVSASDYLFQANDTDDTCFALRRFSVGLNPSVSLQTVI